LNATVDQWAFAWEDKASQGAAADHSLIVEFWAKGMMTPGRLVQRFEPFSRRGKFSLLGDPIVTIEGKVLEQAEAARALVRVTQGIADHPEASKHWPTWVQK